MIVFIDENITHRLLTVLEAVDRDDNKYFCPRSHPFKPSMSDTEWIPLLASLRDEYHSKIVVITQDMRIKNNLVERKALKASGFNLVESKLGSARWEEQAWRFARMWPILRDQIRDNKSPGIYELSGKSLDAQFIGYLKDLPDVREMTRLPREIRKS